MAYDVELLRRLAKRLRLLRHEKHYDQGTWGTKTECGTAACLAGHAAILAGWRLRVNRFDSSGLDARAVQRGAGGRIHVMRVEDVAQDALGLDYHEAHVLFTSNPSQEWPAGFAKRWAARRERPSRIAADLCDAIADGKVEL